MNAPITTMIELGGGSVKEVGYAINEKTSGKIIPEKVNSLIEIVKNII